MKMTLKVIFAFLGLSLLIMGSTPSYAYWGRGHVWIGVGWPGPYYSYPYPYYDPYYDPYYAPTYTTVSSSFQPVVVNGVTYYVNNGTYYIYTQNGYQAVAIPTGAPAVTVPVTETTVPAAQVTVSPSSTDDSITVNIPNSKGGYTAVVLKRSGNGFTGPQGEYYSEFPKVSQLQTMYGK